MLISYLISSGTNICLCCTTRQCSSEAGSDSLPKDLQTFFGGKSWPAIPKLSFPDFFGGKPWSSLPMLPFPKLFGERTKEPEPSFPLFPKLFKSLGPSMNIKNMFGIVQISCHPHFLVGSIVIVQNLDDRAKII